MAIKSITFTSGWSRKTYTVGGKEDRGLTITAIKGPKRGMYEVQCKKGGSTWIVEHNVTEVKR